MNTYKSVKLNTVKCSAVHQTPKWLITALLSLYWPCCQLNPGKGNMIYCNEDMQLGSQSKQCNTYCCMSGAKVNGGCSIVSLQLLFVVGPSNMPQCFRNGSAQTVLRAAAPR